MKMLLLATAVLFVTPAFAELKVGDTAPAFSRPDQTGKTHTLDSSKGKWTVLEWYNEDCPFVKKHYGSNNMQGLQKKYTEKGVVWLTVSTSAKDKEGYIDPKQAAAKMKSAGMVSTALLLDTDGTMGKAYDAKTTPHMFVINPEGKIAYMGAIDSNSSADPKVIAKSDNYVAQALDAALGGKAIAKTSSKPYGCGVKYN